MGPPKGAQSTPHVELIETSVLLFLFANVLPDHGFVSTYSRDEVASGPEVLTHEIALPLPVDPRQMDCALALDEPNHLRDRILRWDRNHHVDVVGHDVPFFNLALLLRRQFAKH